MPPRITAANSSTSDFLYCESYLAARFLELSTYWYDIRGGIEEEQEGLVFAAARNALWHGVSLYLIKRRIVYQMPVSFTAMHSLFADAVDEGDVLDALDELLLRNPATHAEIVRFAGDCRDFIDSKLELKQWREFYGGLSTRELYGRYHQRLLDLGYMAKDLEVELPRPVEAVVEGIRIRNEVERRVAGQAVGGPAGSAQDTRLRRGK